jgi:acyl-coenzyme A synthetase/AMP-(fatty) acid ligase
LCRDLLRGASLVLTRNSVVDACFWEHVPPRRSDHLRRGAVHLRPARPHRLLVQSLPSLRYITQAGGRLEPERVRRYAELGRRNGWRFVVMYGQTEATARMAYLPPEAAASHPTTIGVPVPGGSFELEPLDDAASADEGEHFHVYPPLEDASPVLAVLAALGVGIAAWSGPRWERLRPVPAATDSSQDPKC